MVRSAWDGVLSALWSRLTITLRIYEQAPARFQPRPHDALARERDGRQSKKLAQLGKCPGTFGTVTFLREASIFLPYSAREVVVCQKLTLAFEGRQGSPPSKSP